MVNLLPVCVVVTMTAEQTEVFHVCSELWMGRPRLDVVDVKVVRSSARLA